MMGNKQTSTVAVNRKARHSYFILETMECGLVLTGTEIKSVRDHRVNLKDGYAHFKEGELWMANVHISPYERASWEQHEPLRERKLLLHKPQLRRLHQKIKEKGFTLIPLKMYLKGGRHAKIELALAQGKKQHDKRATLIKKAAERHIAREMRNRANNY